MNPKNLLLKIQYDGTMYHGYQFQPSAPTVQKAVEDALLAITSEKISINGCSRTDAGVHAVEYACSFVTESPIPAERFPLVLNAKLPQDIKALSCSEVPMEFHARFDTITKTYRYIINTQPNPEVFYRNYEWQLKKPLDIFAMNSACRYLIGEKDFASFMTSGTEVSSTIRHIYSVEAKEENAKVIIYIRADGYLYNMVRIITGTLVDIGLGKYPPERMEDIINSVDRSKAGPTAPPQGLGLFKVEYKEGII